MKNLKKLRDAAKMSQDELGSMSGCSPGNLSKYERGLLQPKLVTAWKIARALRIKVEALGVFEEVGRDAE